MSLECCKTYDAKDNTTDNKKNVWLVLKKNYIHKLKRGMIVTPNRELNGTHQSISTVLSSLTVKPTPLPLVIDFLCSQAYIFDEDRHIYRVLCCV